MLLPVNKTIDKLQHDLVREGLLTFDDLNVAQDYANNNDVSLAEALVEKKIISESELLSFMEKKIRIPGVDLNDYVPDKNCLSCISYENAVKYHIFPLFMIEGVLTVAMSDPLDLFVLNKLEEFQNFSVEPVVCSSFSIENAIKKYYLHSENPNQSSGWQDVLISDNLSDEILQNAIYDILKDGVRSYSNDIFMEYSNSGLNIFFDKTLKGFIPNILVPRFLYEFKIISRMNTDIAEIPQNARINITVDDKNYTLFTSFFPTKFGARISVNIDKLLQDIETFNLSREKLNLLFSEPALIGLNNIEDNIVYSLAQFLSEKYSVLMVENIVKYNLPQVAQVELNKNTAICFDEIVNSIEFQKFDIVFFDKISDEEQAEKLKLLAKEVVVAVGINSQISSNCDYVLSSDGKIS